MATTLSPSTFSSFANVSQTSTSGSCGPCTSVQIYDLWRGSWIQNSSLPAIRTLQPYLDPAKNTTSTSTICNTAALTAYDQCARLTVDGNCDLVCEDYNGRQSSESPYTITLSGSSGNFIQFANEFRIQGGVSTTDSNGAYTCLNSSATLPETSYTYAGPTSVTMTGMNLLIMSELTDYYPGEPLFEQCTWFQTGPPPIALTPANEIVLPMMTFPGADTTTTAQSPTTTPTTPTTTARPADTGAGTTPTRTSGTQTTPTDSPNPPEESDGSTAPPPQTDTPDEPDNEPSVTSPGGSGGSPPQATAPEKPDEQPSGTTTQGSADPPVQSDGPDEQDEEPSVIPTQGSITPPTRSDEPEQQNEESDTSPSVVVPTQAGDDAPSTAAQPQSPGASAGSQVGSGNPVIPATTAASPGTTAPIAVVPGVTFQDDGSSPGVIVGGSTTIVAGGAAAVGSGTTFSVLPSAGGIVAVADGSTSTLALPAPVTNAGESFVRPLTTPAPAIALPGATITGGGEVVAVSGTTFSALPSNAGVVAISEGGSTTVEASQLATLGISTVSGNSGAFVLPGQTLAVGGSAVVVSGATYSVLPQGSSVEIASDGQTSVIAIAEATSLPGIGEVSVVDSVADGYILDGSITIVAGGSAATISDVVYSALPSGLGVVVADSNGSDEFASYIEQGISGSESDADGDAPYIIGGTSLPSAGGRAVTVSGVVYSALPSGSGVLVIADGESTTIGLSSTTGRADGGEHDATATVTSSSNGAEESTVPSTGSASSTAEHLTRLSGCMVVGVVALLVML